MCRTQVNWPLAAPVARAEKRRKAGFHHGPVDHGKGTFPARTSKLAHDQNLYRLRWVSSSSAQDMISLGIVNPNPARDSQGQPV